VSESPALSEIETPRGVHLWQDFHSHELKALLKSAWHKNELVIVCPPHLTDFSFVELLPPHREYPEPPALGVFTSGTQSGAPRLVLYSKKNVLAALEGILAFFDPSQLDEIFCYPQPFHTFGLILGYMQAILYEKKLTFHSGKYSREAHALRTQVSNSNTLTLGTPTHFHDLLEYTRAQKISLEPTYSCIIGGATVSVGLWKSIQSELKIQEPSIGYGATEACPGILHHPPGLMPKVEGEIGFRIPGVHLKLIPNVGIEFWGEARCLAIIEKGELTFPEKVLIRDLIERIEPEGMFVFKGRSDLTLNRGGAKFSIEQIENTLHTQLGLKTLCLSLKHERLGADLGIVIESPSAVSSELKMKIQMLLQNEFHQKFELSALKNMEALPLNQNGKLNRFLPLFD
jgi:acyl-coenzyme A synthetase/AMP-(fatty) acid ligase